jgi:hypothetical protein
MVPQASKIPVASTGVASGSRRAIREKCRVKAVDEAMPAHKPAITAPLRGARDLDGEITAEGDLRDR